MLREKCSGLVFVLTFGRIYGIMDGTKQSTGQRAEEKCNSVFAPAAVSILIQRIAGGEKPFFKCFSKKLLTFIRIRIIIYNVRFGQ